MVSFQIAAIDFMVAFFNKGVVGYLTRRVSMNRRNSSCRRSTGANSREMQAPENRMIASLVNVTPNIALAKVTRLEAVAGPKKRI